MCTFFSAVFVTALCEACRETPSAGGLLSHMTGYLPKIPQLRPMESARSLAQRYNELACIQPVKPHPNDFCYVGSHFSIFPWDHPIIIFVFLTLPFKECLQEVRGFLFYGALLNYVLYCSVCNSCWILSFVFLMYRQTGEFMSCTVSFVLLCFSLSFKWFKSPYRDGRGAKSTHLSTDSTYYSSKSKYRLWNVLKM